MNRVAIAIKNRLSLRPPQADSLNILTKLADKLTLKKHTPNPLSRGEYKSPFSGGDLGVGSFLQQELEKVKISYPPARTLKETSLLSVLLWLRVLERRV